MSPEAQIDAINRVLQAIKNRDPHEALSRARKLANSVLSADIILPSMYLDVRDIPYLYAQAEKFVKEGVKSESAYPKTVAYLEIICTLSPN